MKKLLLTLSFLTISTGLFANPGDVLVDTSEAVTASLVQFEADATVAQINLFKGIKASPMSQGVSVKLYLTDGTSIGYSCHRHDATDPFECHRAN